MVCFLVVQGPTVRPLRPAATTSLYSNFGSHLQLTPGPKTQPLLVEGHDCRPRMATMLGKAYKMPQFLLNPHLSHLMLVYINLYLGFLSHCCKPLRNLHLGWENQL